jgi:hypothetical protein
LVTDPHLGKNQLLGKIKGEWKKLLWIYHDSIEIQYGGILKSQIYQFYIRTLLKVEWMKINKNFFRKFNSNN